MSPDKDEICYYHSGLDARLESLEQNRVEIWQAIDKVHERIDGMKNWVIAGMSSLIIQLILWIIGIAIAYLKVKGSI